MLSTFLPPASAIEIIESVLSVSVCVCICVCLSALQHVLMVCVCRSIMAKGLWGEGTLQHGSREVRQCSGIFIVQIYQSCPSSGTFAYKRYSAPYLYTVLTESKFLPRNTVGLGAKTLDPRSLLRVVHNESQNQKCPLGKYYVLTFRCRTQMYKS